MAIPFLTNLDLTKNELQNAVVQNLSVAPASPKAGQIYFSTTDGQPYYYSGSGWVAMNGLGATMTGASIIGAINNESTAKINQARLNLSLKMSDISDLAAAMAGKETAGAAATALSSAKTYADGKASAAEANAKSYADTALSALVGSAPEVLDTFKEIADALGNDPNFATTVTNLLATKADSVSFSVPAQKSPEFTHNLNTRNVTVSVRQTGSPYQEVMVDNFATSADKVKLEFAVAPTAGEYTVTIQG